MNNILAGILASLLLVPTAHGQVRRGSLVVWIVSKQANYVVIGAESRTIDPDRKTLDDQSCKVIALGGDTLFFETGYSQIGVIRGKSWSAENTARTVYASSQQRDALSLSIKWRDKALLWFNTQSEQGLRELADEPNGYLVTGGFIHFDNSATLSVHSMAIFYNIATHSLSTQPSSQAAGQVGISGVGNDLVREFFDGRTQRAVRAFGPVGVVRLIAVDPVEDASNVRKAIWFAMNNAVGEDKLALGGDIDIAVIRNDRTIEWVARKPWCSKQGFTKHSR
jgi:hypothetical protein